jgi:hypothetical protein
MLSWKRQVFGCHLACYWHWLADSQATKLYIDAVVIDGLVEMAWLIVPLLAFWKIQSIQMIKSSGTVFKVTEHISTEECSCETTCTLTKFLVPLISMFLQSAFWLSFNNGCHYFFSVSKQILHKGKVKIVISVIWCMFFWVYPRRPFEHCRRFGILCWFRLQGLDVINGVWVVSGVWSFIYLCCGSTWVGGPITPTPTYPH